MDDSSSLDRLPAMVEAELVQRRVGEGFSRPVLSSSKKSAKGEVE
jgi:hypothetical protein